MADNIGAATLAMTQGISAFTFFLPKISDVRKASVGDPSAVADIRVGEAAGLVVSLGIGGIVSGLTKSSLPVAISLLVALLIICLYETVLRANPIGSPENA